MDEKEKLGQFETDEIVENTADENMEQSSVEETQVLQQDVETPQEVTQNLEETKDNQENTVEKTEDFPDTPFYLESHSDDYEEEDEEDEEVEKRFVLQKPIIIACCILLCSIIVFGGFMIGSKLFGNSIIGTWVLSTEASLDEASKDHKGNGVTYYTFDSDGKAYLTLGSMTVAGEWAYNADDETKVDVNISYFFNGTFTADLSGNIFVGKNLTLGNEYGKYDFVGTSIPKMYAEREENAKFDDKLLGEWKNEDAGIVYTFNADGTCVINQVDTLLIDGVYSVKKNNIEISYISNEVTETNIDYKIKDKNTVILAGLEFTKAK